MLLSDTGRDHARGIELARAGHAKLVAMKSHDPIVDKLANWLRRFP